MSRQGRSEILFFTPLVHVRHPPPLQERKEPPPHPLTTSDPQGVLATHPINFPPNFSILLLFDVSSVSRSFALWPPYSPSPPSSPPFLLPRPLRNVWGRFTSKDIQLNKDKDT